MVRTVRSNVLTRIPIVTIPCLLASVERTRIGVTLSAKVKDRIGGVRIVSDSNHDTVLVRADYSSDIV